MFPGYRVKRGMTYARASIKTGCHHAAIQVVGSHHSAPRHVLILLQSRLSQVVIPQKCGIQSKTSYPTDILWIPRQARYDDLTLRGGDTKSKNVFCKERQILMPASRSCMHPAIILAVSSRHSAPRHVPTLLQSRLSVAIIPHHATCSSYCNPGCRKSSFRRNAESSQRHPTLRMFPGYRVKRGMTT